MMKLAVLAALAGSACAFAPATNGRGSTSLAEKSKAVPFLPNPSNLDGYVGAVGFDPLGISEYFPTDYLVESELKHGRICQLAWLGYVAVDLGARIYPLPDSMQGVTSATAHDPAVAFGSLGNLLGSGRVPGDYGLGTKFLEGKSDAAIADMKLKEVTHCRAAMLAFAGVVTQSVLYDKGFPYV
eukprot:scaffold5837_cov76-Cyclotella_meneghiniana.AAC.12